MSDREAAETASNRKEGSPRASPPAEPQASGARGRVPCKFFLTRRGCSQGSECRFSHSTPPTAAGAEEAVERPRARRSGRPPVCRQFLSASGCRFGEKCRYRHVARQETAERGRSGEDEAQSEEVGLEGRGGRREPSVSQETALLDLTSFPGLGSAAGEALSHIEAR